MIKPLRISFQVALVESHIEPLTAVIVKVLRGSVLAIRMNADHTLSEIDDWGREATLAQATVALGIEG